MSNQLTLAVDCGGGGIKASVLDAHGMMVTPAVRTPSPYPLPPELLVETIKYLASQLPDFDRITVGMPGMIRHGVVVATPHYITKDGPRSKVLPELVPQWQLFDMRKAVQDALGKPTLVLNDAEVAGAGAVTGTGLEMIITLGTGLGNAVFDGGCLAPHVEISQGPVRWGLTYDDYVGEHERLRLGDAHWSRRIRRVIAGLRPMYMWDRLYLGGGNSARITPSIRAKLGDDVVIVPNDAGIRGGARAWELEILGRGQQPSKGMGM
ncbi:ROK family protein [Gleimia coleocanis DSM 15436]|uniref:ROK family protein n=1 Tax=Gleimia coleocanis DSM 15436 TaxID=525245 RepID=C0VZ38_9ACTO|nr:ROK family protein [Gleimia coleocanis]EEH64691.1 ROK family protein [Gleimia coleocanis DSM 15436]